MSMLGRIRSILKDRRTHDEPVAVDRRAKATRKEVQKRYDDAIDELEHTVRMRREDFFRDEKMVANDSQQVVVFRTFSSICRWRNDALKVRLCRNPRHEDAANTGFAKCSEDKCPLLLEALKGAA